MNLDPPAAHNVIPAQADVQPTAKGVPYQQGGSGVDRLGAANQQTQTAANARYGTGIKQSGEAAPAGPVPNMQQLRAGMHHNV